MAALAVVYLVLRTFEQLIEAFILASLPFWALSVASVIVFRRRATGAARVYRTPGYPLVPLLFVVAMTALVINSLAAHPEADPHEPGGDRGGDSALSPVAPWRAASPRRSGGWYLSGAPAHDLARKPPPLGACPEVAAPRASPAVHARLAVRSVAAHPLTGPHSETTAPEERTPGAPWSWRTVRLAPRTARAAPMSALDSDSHA